MGDITTATGAKIFIGPSVLPSTDTEAEYSALTWTEIGLVESLGEFGDQSNTVNFASLNDGRNRKAKGIRDAGDLALTVARDPTDPGQDALIAAEATSNKYAFKVVYPDRLTPTGTDGIDYFRALVMSKRSNVGSADNVIRRAFTLGIDSAIVSVDPT
ncbi:iron ABC transporter substrate-binding protein [Methylobacterium organophilum]|uniref:phage tail tube protein n=1 Tax=Methylobacterium TaxID=407 RepID=UPI0019D2CDDD|nr:phage tail tube protein [Methylobacterium organophilum]MBN6819518.1 iron ABC transporter substrate-binding protein [Methylobacterium organophilum]